MSSVLTSIATVATATAATATSGTLVAEPAHDRGPAVLVVSIIMLVLASTFTAMRMISKGWIVRKVTLDDWMTLLAWLLSTMLTASVMISAKYGLGRPDDIEPAVWMPTLRRAIYSFTALYNPCLMTTKTGILILYVRMSAAHPFLRRASIATMVVVNVAGTVLTCLNLFQCRPVYTAWSADEGKCIDVISLYLSSAPINVLTDLAILLLPLPILTSLRLEFRQKVVLVTTFVVGGFVAIVDVIRIVYLQNALKEDEADASTSILNADSSSINLSYNISFALMWSTVEVSVGLMCCCVLVLKPLVMRFIPAMLKDKDGGGLAGGAGAGAGGRQEMVSAQLETYHLSVLHKDGDENGNGSPLQGFASLGTLGPKVANNIAVAPGQRMSAGIPEEEEGEEGEIDFFQMLASGPQPPQPPQSSYPNPPLLPVPPSPTSPTLARKPSSATAKLTTRAGGYLGGAAIRSRLFSGGGAGGGRYPTNVSHVQEPTQTFFDFVNMGGNKSLTELSAREAWWPVLFTSSLFLLWGFAYGLLGTLNTEIQALLHYSPAKTIALHNAYWIAYFFGPIVIGYPVLTRSGFKSTFMTGLAVFSVGAMAFWPSAILQSYPGFFISNFLVALGLSTLETAANPFIALAGPGELSEARLNFSQGIQGVGGLISPILANKVLFRHIGAKDLFRIQWCYLAVAIFVLFLAVVFFYVPLNEAEDADLEAATLYRLASADTDCNSKVLGVPTRCAIVAGGVGLLWMYVGSQETISYFWVELVRDIMALRTSAFWDQAIGEGLFAFGRFLAAGLCYVGVPPRIVLFACVLGALVTSILGMSLPKGEKGGMIMLILHMFFESAIFPTTFAMALRNQGRHTKMVATALTAAISGGVVWPSAAYGIYSHHSSRPRVLLGIVIGLYSLISVGMIGVNVSKELKRWLDPRWSRGAQLSTSQENAGPMDRQLDAEGQESRLVGLGVRLNGGELKSQASHEFREGDADSTSTRGVGEPGLQGLQVQMRSRDNG